jgi:hypothetical protein
MRLDFEKMVIKDFKAFRGTHTLPLNLPGVTSLVGDNQTIDRMYGNGVAKSTIWDAFIWCLYGQTPLGLRNPDVKPWSGGNPIVTVFFKSDARQNELQRSTSPNSFTLNGEAIADFADTFGLGLKLAINTVLLPQEKPLFFDRRPAEKMLLFSEAMPLERWDTRAVAAGKAADELSGEALAIESDQQHAQGALGELDTSIESLRKQASDWNDKFKHRTRVSQKEIEALRKKRDRSDNVLSGAILEQDSALTELKACERLSATLNREITLVERKLAAIDAQATAAAESVKALTIEFEALTRSKTCPTCGQTIKPTDLASHRKHISERLAAIEERVHEQIEVRKQLVTDKQTKQRQLDANELAAEGFDAKALDAGDIILRHRPEIVELNAKIAAAGTVQTEENPYTKQIAELQKRRKGVLREIAELEAELPRVRAEEENARFWVKGFKDIKLQLIEEVLGELELVTNSMIEEVGLEGWEVHYDIEREAKTGAVTSMLNVMIVSPDSRGKAVRWEAFSGGERQRLRLIGSLVLADVLLARAGIETNLEILDEPAVYWADEGVHELVGFLAERARERDKSIYFIEHSAVESVQFSNVWTVIKDEKGARVER